MSVQIIKQGSAHKKRFEVTCRECETVFRFDPSDIESDRDGTFIRCPTCGTLTDKSKFRQALP